MPPGPLATMIPNSARCPRNPLISIVHQQGVGLVQHQRGLLVHRRDGHKAHGRARDRFADRLGIRFTVCPKAASSRAQ